MKKIIVIVGPTAIGKTDLSITLASNLPAEIISGDAMQVYKGMDIGTGKISENEKQNIHHHMLDIKAPNESFSAAEFKSLVERHIDDIHAKGRIPVIVGGSGLYIQSVLFNYAFSEQKRDLAVTMELEERLKRFGNDVLYKELVQIDPVHAQSIHPNNYRRVIRALEIYKTTGKTVSELQKGQNNTPSYHHFIIGLEMNRKTLYDRINQRVDKMMSAGLEDEVRYFYEQGLEEYQSMKAIGYKEFIPYFKGEVSLEEAVLTLKQNSRRYAKRQYTWFKNKMDIHWYQMDENVREQSTRHILETCKNFVNN